jgi:hypothetical protein
MSVVRCYPLIAFFVVALAPVRPRPHTRLHRRFRAVPGGARRGHRERARAPLSQARQADTHAAGGCQANASRGLSRSSTTTALRRLRTSSQLLRTP